MYNTINWPVFAVAPASPTRGALKGRPGPLPIAGKVSQAAYDVIERSQPYHYVALGADPKLHPLRVLHELNIIDKHGHIAVEGIVFTRLDLCRRRRNVGARRGFCRPTPWLRVRCRRRCASTCCTTD